MSNIIPCSSVNDMLGSWKFNCIHSNKKYNRMMNGLWKKGGWKLGTSFFNVFCNMKELINKNDQNVTKIYVIRIFLTKLLHY